MMLFVDQETEPLHTEDICNQSAALNAGGTGNAALQLYVLQGSLVLQTLFSTETQE